MFCDFVVVVGLILYSFSFLQYLLPLVSAIQKSKFAVFRQIDFLVAQGSGKAKMLSIVRQTTNQNQILPDLANFHVIRSLSRGPKGPIRSTQGHSCTLEHKFVHNYHTLHLIQRQPLSVHFALTAVLTIDFALQALTC